MIGELSSSSKGRICKERVSGWRMTCVGFQAWSMFICLIELKISVQISPCHKWVWFWSVPWRLKRVANRSHRVSALAPLHLFGENSFIYFFHLYSTCSAGNARGMEAWRQEDSCGGTQAARTETNQSRQVRGVGIERRLTRPFWLARVSWRKTRKAFAGTRGHVYRF